MWRLYFLLLVTFNSSIPKPLIIAAHRGASGYEPGNTLSAFKRALEMGAPLIELDVQRCKSGQLVVIHDDTITVNGIKKNISELPWNVLKTYDVGNGQKIPLLSQVFDLINKQATIIIELKDTKSTKAVADLIMHYIQHKNWSEQNFIIESFDHYRLLEFRNYCPRVKTAVLFEGNPIGLAQIVRNAHAGYAFMYHQWITKEFVADAHKYGIQVFAYTVNTKPLAKKLQNLDIDGIITDYPDLLG